MITIPNAEQKRQPYYRQARASMRKVLKSQSDELCKRLRDCTDVKGMILESEKPVRPEPVDKALRQIYGKTGKAFAQMILKQFGKRKALDPKMRGRVETDEWLMYMDRFVTSRLGDRIKIITGTTEELFKQAVRNITEKGLQEGLSVYQMTKEIQKDLDISNLYRAERIARTEVGSASNEASMAGAKSLGESLRKVWMGFNDGRERESHIALNGTTIEMDDEFMPGLAYPCDPNGDAEEVINCRCSIGYEEKEADDITIGRF